MIKCVYNGLKLGHNLVKKKQIKSRDLSNKWVVTPKDKTRVLLPSPFAFLHCLNAKIE